MLQYDGSTTVKDFLEILNSRLIEESSYAEKIKSYFGLAIVVGPSSDPDAKEPTPKLKKLHMLEETDLIMNIRFLPYAPKLRLLYRMVYPPLDLKSLYRQNQFAFDYLYTQSCNDLRLERFNPELDHDTSLKLCAMTIMEHVYSNHSDVNVKNPKMFIKLIKKSPGIGRFLPSSMVVETADKKFETIKAKLVESIKNVLQGSEPGPQKSKSLTTLDRYSSPTFHGSLMPDLKSSPVDYMKLVFLESLAQLPCFGNSKRPDTCSSSSACGSVSNDYAGSGLRTPTSTSTISQIYPIIPPTPSNLYATKLLTEQEIAELIVPPLPPWPKSHRILTDHRHSRRSINQQRNIMTTTYT